MGKKFDWTRARRDRPALSLSDEADRRSNDSAARWLANNDTSEFESEIAEVRRQIDGVDDGRQVMRLKMTLAALRARLATVKRGRA